LAVKNAEKSGGRPEEKGQIMFRKAVALTPVALVGAGIALALAGCGTPAASAAGQGPTTAAHQVAAQRQAGTAAHAVQPQPLAATQRPEATKQAAGTTAPPAGAADSEATATAAPAAPSPGSSSRSPGSSSRPAGTPSAAAAETLPAGLYEDGQEGTPRYVLALTHTAPAVIVGSVEFFYQDGRTASAGGYTGTLAGSSGMTLRFADGKAVTAIYHGTTLTITDCAAALPFATESGACTFTFHGATA
jgi:hypothetical protein